MTGEDSPPEVDLGDSSSATRSKVAKVLSEYDLHGLGQELESRWTSPSDDRASLRELAHDLNKEILRAATQEAGLSPLDGEVANIYRLLTEDDVSPGDRTEARRRLERAGIDADRLEADFVSRQAIHTYLTEVRDATYQSTNSDPVGEATTQLERLKNRLATVTEAKLATLRDAGHITLGPYRVVVDIQVFCQECGRQYPHADLLSSGACACEGS